MVSYEHKVKNIYLGSPGGGSHIPSSSEFSDLKSIMDGLSLTTGNGYKIRLHMPFAGDRNSSSSVPLEDQGKRGVYWSSSPCGSAVPECAISFRFGSTGATLGNNYRAMAFSVRCFSDEYVEPDNTWTVVDGTLGSAGIFHNSTLGLISVTNGSNKNITMKDKNEGATTVYNDGDTLTEANMGNMYQWGNYYGFPSTGTISNKTSTKINTTGYGNDNPYSSSTFRTGNDWSNPSNDSLRANSKEEYFVIE